MRETNGDSKPYLKCEIYKDRGACRSCENELCCPYYDGKRSEQAVRETIELCRALMGSSFDRGGKTISVEITGDEAHPEADALIEDTANRTLKFLDEAPALDHRTIHIEE